MNHFVPTKKTPCLIDKQSTYFDNFVIAIILINSIHETSVVSSLTMASVS